jgi:hypothetical protein
LCVYTVSGKYVAAGIADRYYSTNITNTYLPTPWSKVLLEKLTGIQLVNKFPAFYGTHRIITAFTSAFVCIFRNKICFYGEETLAPRRNPKAGGPPIVGCPRVLIQYIRNYPPYWRPFLHPQHEDAPCHFDRDPLITGYYQYNIKFIINSKIYWYTEKITILFICEETFVVISHHRH